MLLFEGYGLEYILFGFFETLKSLRLDSSSLCWLCPFCSPKLCTSQVKNSTQIPGHFCKQKVDFQIVVFKKPVGFRNFNFEIRNQHTQLEVFHQ